MTTVMEMDGSRLSVTAREMQALSDVGNLVQSGSRIAQDQALARARQVAKGRDAVYALAVYQLEIGRRRQDDRMLANALDVLIDNGLSPANRLPGFLALRGQIAFRTGDIDKADRLWGRLAAMSPADADAQANLAQVKLARSEPIAALALLTRAVALRGAIDPHATEVWQRQRLSIAQQARLVQPGIEAARDLLLSHPSPGNWRAALMVYRDLAGPSGPAEVDLLRLMRGAGVLLRGAEYQRLAQLLRLEGEAAEAKAVLDEGLQRGLIDAQTSPTREIMVEVDRSIANPRRHSGPLPEPGNAGRHVRQALSHLRTDKTAAVAEFRAAARDSGGGRHAELAAFWLILLKQ